MSRDRIKKACWEINNVGERLAFVRRKLKLTLREVYEETRVPVPSIHNHEVNYRTSFYEELLMLASFYNKLWQEQYNIKAYPIYQDKSVEAITFSWICLGFDPLTDQSKMMIQEIKDNYTAREFEYLKRQDALENQLEMFKAHDISQ